MAQGFTQPPGGTFSSSSGGFSGGQSGFGGGSQGGGFGGTSGNSPGGFSTGVPGGSFGGGGFGGGTPSSSGSPFSSSYTASSGGGRLQSAPVLWILLGAIAGAIGIGLNVWLTIGSFVATDTAFALIAGIAWVLAGICGALLVGRHMVEVNTRKATGFYTDLPGIKILFNIAAVLLVIAVIWSVWDIALWVGKL